MLLTKRPVMLRSLSGHGGLVSRSRSQPVILNFWRVGTASKCLWAEIARSWTNRRGRSSSSSRYASNSKCGRDASL